MRILAIIPARGGSKGIPRKNLELLGPHPLVGWSILAALESKSCHRVVVSTDDDEIARIARDYGADVPFMRPQHLGEDDTPALDVIMHAIGEVNSDEKTYDVVCYLQPTSPFRSGDLLEQALKKFKEHSPDTLVSVERVAHNRVESSRMESLKNDNAELIWLRQPETPIFLRQLKPIIFARNGPAILINSVDSLIENAGLYGKRIVGFEMDKLSSLDIDEPIDLEMARYLLPLYEKRLSDRLLNV